MRPAHISRVAFLIFSGLPASGKSTVARETSQRLALPVIDKDDFLDALFVARGIGDARWRSALSREADALFSNAAQGLSSGGLVSWWRHPKAITDSGTPTEWLATLSGELIEVYCRCRVEIAVDRFLARRRHPGHLDSSRSRTELTEQFEQLATLGPLGLGDVIDINSGDETVVPDLIQQINVRRPSISL